MNRADTRNRSLASEQRLATVVHELRNPLAGVRGVIQIVCSRLPPHSQDRALLNQAIERLTDVDAMLSQLAPGSSSGVHAIELPPEVRDKRKR
ncbi:MAG TPA: histidine kinase dimerization/phospho-acceptor domain-containing protein [Polyangiaceae bacterium]|jgi:nitrogen-specific signal transduction histidine kinase|nr:histidine kinase dimerization/phospho-acceptor domain-containing protein [Polyangiaceae bacterium]